MSQKVSDQLAALLAVTANPPWFGDGRKDRCAYCGEATNGTVAPTHPHRATRDHILAKAQGGKVTVPACKACNTRKAGKLFPEFLADAETVKLRSRPAARPWPEHELWAAYAAAVLRKTHALMALSASGSAPSSPAQAPKASAGTSAPKKARAPG